MRRILFFGFFDPGYSRNSILRRGFEENGWEAAECRVDLKGGYGPRKYLRLWRLGRKARSEPWDLVLVAYPGQTAVLLARLLFRKNKIVFDAFLSLYDSNVFDRRHYAPWSLAGRKDWFLGWLSCSLAPVVLLDTHEHIRYFRETFHQPLDKFIRVLVGANDQVFYPRPVEAMPDTPFIVYFCGHFIPLQGVEYIIEAAAILRDEPVEFRLVGHGQDYGKVVAMIVRNGLRAKIRLLGERRLEELPDLMAAAHLCLGIFGETPKAARVIPNKVYEALATGRPVLTGDSPAEREVFTDGRELQYCRLADGRDLAAKILSLKSDPARRSALAKKGYEFFVRHLRPRFLVAQLLQDLKSGHHVGL